MQTEAGLVKRPPEVLFYGVYRVREAGYKSLAVGCLAMAAFFTVLGVCTEGEGRTVVMVAVLLWLAVGGTSAYFWLRDRAYQLEISTRGLSFDGTFHPWPQVAFFGASIEVSGAIWLEWSPQLGHVPRPLPTTPALSESDWQSLVERLEKLVLPRQPHLVLDRQPRVAPMSQ